MGSFLNNFLSQLLPNTSFKDYQHAARLYIDDNFALAPKSTFMYHVVFELNPKHNVDKKRIILELLSNENPMVNKI